MSQRQYTTYQSNILSFELRDAMLGLLQPGRYCGYDTMVANGAQVDNNIPIFINHTATGIPKYGKEVTPVLEAIRGVALTTQGTVIAEDGNVSVTVTLRAVAAGGRHKIYMIHAYQDNTPGVNPATYGIISWDAGSAEPALPNPTKNVVLGYIIEAPNATSIANLTYHPAMASMGDQDLYKKLFRGDADGHMITPGTDPAAEGIIGDRDFSGVYVTPFSSLTEAISSLNSALNTEETARIAIGDRPLDSAAWGALTNITQQNATTARHGLFPKLDGDASKFINGIGDWVRPSAKHIVWRTGIPAGSDYSYSISLGGPQTADLSTVILDLDADIAIIEVVGRNASATSTAATFSFYTAGQNIDTGARFRLNPNSIDPQWPTYAQMMVKLDYNNHVEVEFMTLTGTLANVQELGFRVLGWQVPI